MKPTLCIAALLLATPAAAGDDEWSLEERAYFEALTAEIQQYADLANTACETELTFDLDRPSFKGVFNSKAKHGLDVFRLDAITEPFRQIRFICLDGKPQAAAVKKGIAKVRLGFRDPPKQALAKRTLVVHVPTKGNKRAWADGLKAFLKKKL